MERRVEGAPGATVRARGPVLLEIGEGAGVALSLSGAAEAGPAPVAPARGAGVAATRPVHVDAPEPTTVGRRAGVRQAARRRFLVVGPAAPVAVPAP